MFIKLIDLWRNASDGRRLLSVVLGLLLVVLLVTSSYQDTAVRLSSASAGVAAEWAAFDALCETNLPEEFRKRVNEWRGSKADATGEEYEKLVAGLKQDETRLQDFCAIWTARFFQLTLDHKPLAQSAMARPSHDRDSGAR